MAQKKNCKLYYTHSKEEISSTIKHVNQRLEDSDDEDSSSEDDEMTKPLSKRISEMSKMQYKPKAKEHMLPLHGHLELKHTPQQPHRLPTTAASKHLHQSPATSPPSSTSRLSGPNVPPGTSVNVSSFSLIQHAKAKKLNEKGSNKKSPDVPKKGPKVSPTASKKTGRKDTKASPTSDKKSKGKEAALKKEKPKPKSKAAMEKEKKKEKETTKNAKGKQNNAKKRKRGTESDQEVSVSDSDQEKDSDDSSQDSEESSPNPPAKTVKKQQKPQKAKNVPPAKKPKKEQPPVPEKRRGSRRAPKKRKAALNQSGNLASEILDMLLSSSNESDESDQEEDSSDESWK